MPRPPIDLSRKIKDILGYVDPLPPEACAPFGHYERSMSDNWNLLQYLERSLMQPNLKEDRTRFETLSILWQLRHTAVHNVGVLTQSDAVKLRLLLREPVEAPRILAPTRDDIRYLKRFLDEIADYCNRRIGYRLAELITSIHQATPVLFDAQQKADELSSLFAFPVTINNQTGSVATV